MTQANIPHNLLAFWVSGSLYAANSPAEALSLAKESDRTAIHALENVKAATSEDLAEVVPWGDGFVTLDRDSFWASWKLAERRGLSWIGLVTPMSATGASGGVERLGVPRTPP